jgi:hypothetical protein
MLFFVWAVALTGIAFTLYTGLSLCYVLVFVRVNECAGLCANVHVKCDEEALHV